MKTPGQLRHDIAVAKVKLAIAKDIELGIVPAPASSFSELHNYVDANTYLLEALPGLHVHGPWFGKANAVIAEISEWLKGGRK